MNATRAVPIGRPGLEDALDFINTLEHSRDGDEEHLPTPDAAAGWLVERGALDRSGAPGSPALDERDLAVVRTARDSMRELVDAVVEHRAPAEPAIAALNELLRLADAPLLVPQPHGVTVAAEHRGAPLRDALAHLVQPLVAYLAEGDVSRLRICDNVHCRWVFQDGSRTGRRRWCDMTTCGNRAKAARHRARRRAEGA